MEPVTMGAAAARAMAGAATGAASGADEIGATLATAALGGVAARPIAPVAVWSTPAGRAVWKGLEKGLSENRATSLLQAPSAAARMATAETRVSAGKDAGANETAADETDRYPERMVHTTVDATQLEPRH
jgi:hypothetical protein